MNADGTVKSSTKIASGLNGGPVLANNDRFGWGATPLGDFDGDGVADMAVGSLTDSTGGASRGAVHVMLLNPDGTVKSSQKIASGVGGGPVLANDDLFGRSLTALSDLNGDGVTDLAVGAAGDDTNGAERGAVYLLFMNPDGTVDSHQIIASSIGGGPALADGDNFGFSVEAVGDIDGDGVQDLTVGAAYDDTAGTNRGAVHLLYLNADGTVKSIGKIASGVSGGPTLVDEEAFGSAVTSLGDLDGDGVIDLAVGSEQADVGGTDRGAVRILFLNKVNTNPVFTSTDEVEVPENTTSVLTVTATDADLPPQTVTFSIVGGADETRFAITEGGELSFQSTPDVEAPSDSNAENVYEVTIEASDGDGGTSTQTINVTVTPVNDNLPMFTSLGAVDVPENSTDVLLVTATDDDLPEQSIEFSIVGGADSDKFSITSGGELSFIDPPDFETPVDAGGDNVYEVTVQADDGAGGMMTQMISVTVTSLNDNIPVFTSPDTVDVAENETAVLTVTATDADLPEQDLTFSIVGGADQSKFDITSDGELTLVAGLDFEAPTDGNGDGIYVVIVQATDGFTPSFQAILVTVTPVNDNDPVFTSPTSVDVDENTTEVLTVTATDADLPSQAVTFSIVGGADESRFSITSGGVLTFSEAPDFESPTDANEDNVYEVTVEANDGQDGTTTQTILATVQNVEEPLTGDYNRDDRVNIADYTIWRDARNSTVLPHEGADGDGSGVIDDADYTVWKENFGNTAPDTLAASQSLQAAEVQPVQGSANGDRVAVRTSAHATLDAGFARLAGGSQAWTRWRTAPALREALPIQATNDLLLRPEEEPIEEESNLPSLTRMAFDEALAADEASAELDQELQHVLGKRSRL